nr:MAG TPA: ExsB [Caudoviricetes sp.]
MVTNEDKIRSMSSEDLEELLRRHNIVCDLDREWCESRTEGCQNCTKTWLQQPAGGWKL